jgi:hypothetical protein
MPRISRLPSALTPVAIKVCTPTTRPFSRTLSTSASAATNVYGPASRGRARNASTCSSSSTGRGLPWCDRSHSCRSMVVLASRLFHPVALVRLGSTVLRVQIRSHYSNTECRRLGLSGV